jgi:hypothetical protein
MIDDHYAVVDDIIYAKGKGTYTKGYTTKGYVEMVDDVIIDDHYVIHDDIYAKGKGTYTKGYPTKGYETKGKHDSDSLFFIVIALLSFAVFRVLTLKSFKNADSLNCFFFRNMLQSYLTITSDVFRQRLL